MNYFRYLVFDIMSPPLKKRQTKKRAVDENMKAKKMKKIDQLAPKAAKSSYMIFFTQYRNQLKV